MIIQVELFIAKMEKWKEMNGYWAWFSFGVVVVVESLSS